MRKFLKVWWVKVIIFFIVWRILLFGVAILAPFFIPKFGNQFPYANSALIPSGLPQWIWAFGNFDGVHYVRAALTGYESQYSQAFFPLYFLLMKDLSIFMSPVLAGLILSNTFFLGGLLMFYKLLRFDFDKKTSLLSILFLISFPTAFYFGAIYTESLFFLLMVTSLWYMRSKNLFYAGLFALLASATRITGLLIFPVLLWKFYRDWKNRHLKFSDWEGKKALIGVLIAPMGAVLYTLYLWANFGDPLLFLNAQPGFGAQRSAHPFILLPQVLYRYFKILATVSIGSQSFFNAVLEMVFALMMIFVLLKTFKKVRKDYWFFSATALLMPTLTGTFSSMPRYSLMIFLLIPTILKMQKNLKWLAILLMCILQIILAMLFLRGYWIA